MRLRRIEPALRRALRGECRLPRGATLLVAVSGGADSTALVVALASLAHEFGLSLHAAHLDHSLRGAESRGDAAHVRSLCHMLGVPLTSARWDCRARMRREGLAGEAGLRTLRQRFLRAAAKRAGAAAIATAHTADDQLETLLMRLARGASLTGIAGMRAQRGAWRKPLLAVTRAEIEHDLTRARLAWRDDASNASRDFARNRVRHDVVPALLAALAAPAAGSAAAQRAPLARRAAALAGELAAAERLLARRAGRALLRSTLPGGAALDAAALARLPEPVLALALRRAWRQARPRSGRARRPAPGLTRAHLLPLLRGLRQPRRTAVFGLPLGWRARLAGGQLRFEPPTARQTGLSQHDAAPDAILAVASAPVRRRRRRKGPLPLAANSTPRRASSRHPSPPAASPANRQERP